MFQSKDSTNHKSFPVLDVQFIKYILLHNYISLDKELEGQVDVSDT